MRRHHQTILWLTVIYIYIFKVFPIDTLFSVLNNPQFDFHIYCALFLWMGILSWPTMCTQYIFFEYVSSIIVKLRKGMIAEFVLYASFLHICIYESLKCLQIRKAYTFVYWKTRVFVSRAYRNTCTVRWHTCRTVVII